MKEFKHLSFTDRLRIESWEKANVKPKDMAEMLGVHISTIYRELKRGRYERLNTDYTTTDRYSPDIAEKKYREHLSEKGVKELKIGKDREYAEYLEYKVVVEKYSPGAVLGEIKRKGLEFSTSISKTTFYRYIDEGLFLTLTNKNLPIKRNKNKKKYKRVQAARAPKGKSIENRPAEIDTRDEFGNWEMDCVVGKRGTKKTLLVLTERKSRYEIIKLMKDHTADSVVKAIDEIEKEYKDNFSRIFKTITVDNGSEFSNYSEIENNKTEKRLDLFYCHPYSSWERGSNENLNRMIRRHFPKGTDFTKIKKAEITKLEKWMNNYPREMFQFYSAQDIFDACLDNAV